MSEKEKVHSLSSSSPKLFWHWGSLGKNWQGYCISSSTSLFLCPISVGLPHLPSAHYCCFVSMGLYPSRLNGLGLILQLLLRVPCPVPLRGWGAKKVKKVKNEQLTQQYPGSVSEMGTQIQCSSTAGWRGRHTGVSQVNLLDRTITETFVLHKLHIVETFAFR